jgi:transposase-like protein
MEAEIDRFSEEHFRNDDAARAWFESMLWPDGPVCPHCGVINHAYPTKRRGVYRCAEKECRKDFTVTMKTVMERSHIALHKWAQAFHLMCSSKKGISAHQLHRTLDVTYRAALFMAHRIRHAMRAGGLAAPLPPMGEGGGHVEADETYIGRIKGFKKGPGGHHKNAVLSLLDRDTKQVRSFHIAGASADSIAPIVRKNLSREAHLMTDEGRWFKPVGAMQARHETVDHSWEEYVREVTDPETGEEYKIHVNTLEGYFSVFKKGMHGVYQHCSEKHLHRYLAEFDFRYNNRSALGCEDGERATRAVKSAKGKRLTYRQPDLRIIPFPVAPVPPVAP